MARLQLGSGASSINTWFGIERVSLADSWARNVIWISKIGHHMDISERERERRRGTQNSRWWWVFREKSQDFVSPSMISRRYNMPCLKRLKMSGNRDVIFQYQTALGIWEKLFKTSRQSPSKTKSIENNSSAGLKPTRQHWLHWDAGSSQKGGSNLLQLG